jgi:hypothetical protein
VRELLDYDEVAIQHNAAGVLGRIAGTALNRVVPAVDELRALSDHDEAAVRRVATQALARLARERPGCLSGR